MQAIVDSIHRHDFIDEILVWNNNPGIQLQLEGHKVRVINSVENMLCYGRFLCAGEAKNELIYVQDDDTIVKNIPALRKDFLNNESMITHGLYNQHYKLRERYHHFYGQVALLGWGAIFKKSWLRVLDDFLKENKNDYLFKREADQIFTLLQGARHKAIKASLTLLRDHSTDGIALYREPEHYLHKALAVRKGIGFQSREKRFNSASNLECGNHLQRLRALPYGSCGVGDVQLSLIHI